MRKISVITVCHNSGETIQAALESISIQKYKHFEHVVIDGGSTDNTLDILSAWQKHKIILSTGPDKGIYDAMNKGLALATGEIVGYLNSDDVFANPYALELVAESFKDETVGACFADLVYVDKEDLNKIIRYWKSSPFKPGSFSKSWCPPHPTFYVRKSIYNRLGGFNLNYKLAADSELMMRILEKEHIHSVYIPEVIVKMRLGGETNKSLSNIIMQNVEIFNALKSHDIPFSPVKFGLIKLITRVTQRMNTRNVA